MTFGISGRVYSLSRIIVVAGFDLRVWILFALRLKRTNNVKNNYSFLNIECFELILNVIKQLFLVCKPNHLIPKFCFVKISSLCLVRLPYLIVFNSTTRFYLDHAWKYRINCILSSIPINWLIHLISKGFFRTRYNCTTNTEIIHFENNLIVLRVL